MDYDGPEITIERGRSYSTGAATPESIVLRVYLGGKFIGTLYNYHDYGLSWMSRNDARSTLGPLSILAEAMAASVLKELQ